MDHVVPFPDLLLGKVDVFIQLDRPLREDSSFENNNSRIDQVMPSYKLLKMENSVVIVEKVGRMMVW